MDINVGDQVAVFFRKGQVGTVCEVDDSESQPRYRVKFADGDQRWYYGVRKVVEKSVTTQQWYVHPDYTVSQTSSEVGPFATEVEAVEEAIARMEREAARLTRLVKRGREKLNDLRTPRAALGDSVRIKFGQHTDEVGTVVGVSLRDGDVQVVGDDGTYLGWYTGQGVILEKRVLKLGDRVKFIEKSGVTRQPEGYDGVIVQLDDSDCIYPYRIAFEDRNWGWTSDWFEPKQVEAA